MKAAVFSERAEICAGVLLSLITGAVWFFLCGYDRSLTIYHDEVTYTGAARDIYNGLSPLLQHLRPSYFSKVFYSYLIAPGFAFSDPTHWQAFINAVSSGLTVLFTWLCSRLLIESCRLRIICVLLTALMPLHSYAAYATPDCLFFCETALSFLIFTALCRSILDGLRMRTVLLLAVLLGMVNFISYFTKEVAAAFIISETAALTAAPFVAGGKRREFFQALAASVLTFILFYLYLKFVLIPESTGNSYRNQIEPFETYIKAEGWDGVVWKFFYMATWACFSVYLIPLLAPVFEFRRLPPAGRILFLTVLCSFVLLTLAVIYMISWREDYDLRYPVWHFRYHAACLPVFLVLAVLSWEKRACSAGGMRLRHAVPIIFCIAMAVFYPWSDRKKFASVYDNPTINLFRHSLFLDGTGLEWGTRRKISFFMLLLSVSVFSLPFIVKGAGRRARIAGIASLTAAAVLFAVTGSCYMSKRFERGITPELRSDAIELASFLDSLSGGVRILFVDNDRSSETSSFYTFVRRPFYAVPAVVFRRDAAGSGIFDFSVPHRIGAAEFGYDSRLIYETVIMPSPDVIVESSGTQAEFAGLKTVFRSIHYSVLLSGRTADLPVRQQVPVRQDREGGSKNTASGG